MTELLTMDFYASLKRTVQKAFMINLAEHFFNWSMPDSFKFEILLRPVPVNTAGGMSAFARSVPISGVAMGGVGSRGDDD